MLSHGAHTNNHNVQEMALSAIASTAAAAAADFAPYVAAVRACVFVMLLFVCLLGPASPTTHALIQSLILPIACSTESSACTRTHKCMSIHTSAQVMPALQHFLNVQSPEMMACRCRATECMGLMLEHLGGSQQAATELIPQVRVCVCVFQSQTPLFGCVRVVKLLGCVRPCCPCCLIH